MNIYVDPKEWLDISYCNVEEDLGHIFDLKPHTNIDSLPGFKNPENGNFQLDWDSPCINRGDPDTTGMHLPDFDLTGNERIFDGRVDIGAYEFNRTLDNSHILMGSDFMLYPNPGSGFFFLENRTEALPYNHLVRIYNVWGKLVLEKRTDADESAISIDISRQPDGVYLLSVLSEGRHLYRQKIIKH